MKIYNNGSETEIRATDGPQDEIEFLSHLGSGGFGSVDLIQHRRWGKVAYKTHPASSVTKKCLKQLRKEATIQQRLWHPHIVILFDAKFDSKLCGLFLEYMKYGTVDVFLEDYQVNWEWKIQIIHDVASGMLHLHEQKPAIIHGDLKCQNILIGEGYHAKISDFGLTHVMQQLSTSDPVVSGTIRYIAPEYLSGVSKMKMEGFDIYAYSISVWEILCEKLAYYDFCDTRLIWVSVVKGIRPEISDVTGPIPEPVLTMMEKGWDQDDAARPRFKTILEVLSNQLTLLQADLKEAYISLTEQEQQVCPTYDQTDSVQLIRAPEVEDQPRTFIEGYNEVRQVLVDYIDPNHGLLYILEVKSVLTNEEYTQLGAFMADRKKSYTELNEELLSRYISTRITQCCSLFLNALEENHQGHIAEFTKSGGANVDSETRLLTEREITIINDNLFCLVKLIDPYKMKFLLKLVACKCITERHKVRLLEQFKDPDKRIDELLTILKRRSYKDFINFKKCLHDTMQNKIVGILEQGGVVTVRVKLHKRVDRKIIESKLVALITDKVDETREDGKTLSAEQISFIKDLLRDLEEADINLMGSSTGHSIAVFFQCKTESSRKKIELFQKSGELKRRLERLFRYMLQIPESESELIQTASIKDQPIDLSGKMPTGPFQYRRPAPLEELEDVFVKSCYINFMPRELAEIIIRKAFVGLLTAGWKSGIRTTASLTGYNLFYDLSSSIGKSVFSTLKSVSYQWKRCIPLKRRILLKLFFLNLVHENGAQFVERLNCDDMFLDCMVQKAILSRWERLEIDASEKSLPQVAGIERDAHPGKVNQTAACSKFLKCLSNKSYSKILKFLKLMEENCSTHLLHSLFSTERLSVFRQVWPLEDNIRSRLMTHERILLKEMNIMLQTHSSNSDKLELTKNDFYPSLETSPHPLPGRMNLTDLLHLNRCISLPCISLLQKQHIQQQPTSRLRNLELFHLLKNGSIETFHLAVEYFKQTGQKDVCDYLTGKYYEGVQLAHTIRIPDETRGVTGVAWLENKIYIICRNSNKIRVFTDDKPFAELREEEFDVDDMKDPYDTACSQVSRSLFISDWKRNQCIWKIHVPSKEISRWSIDGVPRGLSITSADEILAVIKRDDEYFLNLYGASDF